MVRITATATASMEGTLTRRSLLMSLAAVAGLAALGHAQGPKYEALHTNFECPLALSSPQRLGLDARSLAYPAEAKSPQFEIVVCEFSKGAFAAMREAGQDPYAYAKTTYLGQTRAGSQKSSRKIMQAERQGEVYPESFPHKDYLECLWLERKEGSAVLLAFRVAPSMDRKQANQAIEKVCQTFQWTPQE